MVYVIDSAVAHACRPVDAIAVAESSAPNAWAHRDALVHLVAGLNSRGLASSSATWSQQELDGW
jgi:hypothetical protein